MSTVYKTFCESVAIYPDHDFLHIPAAATQSYQDTAVTLTYAEAGLRVEELKSVYTALGYGLGHRVGLLLENRADFFLHWFALNALGVSVVPVNGELSTKEKAYLLEHSEVCLVVSLPEKLGDVALAAQAARIQLVTANVYDLSSLPQATTPATQSEAGEDTECALLYTSGSTGKPKGCVLSNEFFIVCGEWYMGIGGLCSLDTGCERLLTPLPVTHMNAMAASSMVMIMTGGCIVQLDRFRPSQWWQTVEECRPTIIHYLGVMPAILLSMDASDIETKHSIKFGFGAGVNASHHGVFEDRFKFPLLEAWAMTESGCGGGIIANHEPRRIGTSCIGKPPENLEVRLIDEEGHEVVHGEPGELLIRGKGDNPRRGFFTRYLKNPEATAEIWEGGWLHTGDVVRFGEDGQLHFVDRRKNIIRRSGENISALEVEAILATHPVIEQLAVAPVPDELRGDEVMACVILTEGTEATLETAQQLFDHCGESLAYFKAPGYIAFVDSMPLTPSQKPQRGELKVLCRNLVSENTPGCFDLRDLKKHNARAQKTAPATQVGKA